VAVQSHAFAKKDNFRAGNWSKGKHLTELTFSVPQQNNMAVRVYKQSLRLPERPWSIFLTGTDRTGKHDCIRPSSRYSKGKPENCVFRPLRMVDVEVAYGFASNLFNLGHHGTDRWGKQPLAVYTSPLYPMDVRRPRNLYAFGAEIVDGICGFPKSGSCY
jgi:hypothetical protein